VQAGRKPGLALTRLPLVCSGSLAGAKSTLASLGHWTRLIALDGVVREE